MKKKQKKLIIVASFAFILAAAWFFGVQPIITGRAISEAYNVEVEIPKEYRNIISGGKLWFTTKILNLASEGRVDVTLKYKITNSEGELLTSRSETVAIETQASFVGTIDLPSEAIPGDYLLEVEMSSASGDITSGETQFVIKEEKTIKDYLEKNKFVLTTVLLGILIIIFIISFRKKIAQLFKRMRINARTNEIIKNKIKNKQISAEELGK